MDDMPLLKAKELQRKLGDIALSSLYRMAADNLIPSVLIGKKLGHRRFVERDVRAALARLTRPPRPYHPRKADGARSVEETCRDPQIPCSSHVTTHRKE